MDRFTFPCNLVVEGTLVSNATEYSRSASRNQEKYNRNYNWLLWSVPACFSGLFGNGSALGGCEFCCSGFTALQAAHASERDCGGILFRLGLGFVSNQIDDRFCEGAFGCA